jgi:hypothetical protein
MSSKSYLTVQLVEQQLCSIAQLPPLPIIAAAQTIDVEAQLSLDVELARDYL